MQTEKKESIGAKILMFFFESIFNLFLFAMILVGAAIAAFLIIIIVKSVMWLSVNGFSGIFEALWCGRGGCV